MTNWVGAAFDLYLLKSLMPSWFIRHRCAECGKRHTVFERMAGATACGKQEATK